MSTSKVNPKSPKAKFAAIFARLEKLEKEVFGKKGDKKPEPKPDTPPPAE